MVISKYQSSLISIIFGDLDSLIILATLELEKYGSFVNFKKD